MHGHAIAHEIIEKARKKGEPKAIEVEVGELSTITPSELMKSLKQHVNWKVRIFYRKGVVACACGFKGKPKILAREHDLVLFACPKCGAAPQAVKGNSVFLKKVTLDATPTFLAVGNPLLEGDSLALAACKRASKKSSASFVFCESLDDLMEELSARGGKKIVVDAAKGISKPRLVKLKALKAEPVVGAHSFDAGFFLRLAEAAGAARGVKVLALPENSSLDDAVHAVLKAAGGKHPKKR
ncbi:MAG: hypothetical protein ACP5O3_00190 [Candidatus Micrarchaeia archaeon]